MQESVCFKSFSTETEPLEVLSLSDECSCTMSVIVKMRRLIMINLICVLNVAMDCISSKQTEIDEKPLLTKLKQLITPLFTTVLHMQKKM